MFSRHSTASYGQSSPASTAVRLTRTSVSPAAVAARPDLSQVPAHLRVPSLLICGTEDTTYDAMVRAARTGILPLVSLDGADHMSSFLSEQARQVYLRFLREIG